jgi:phage terminase large subunit
MTYEIQYAPDLQVSDYTPYGGCREFMYCKEPEFIASGPAETGKTIAACWRIHLMALKYPGCQGSIVRKTQADVYGSVLQTFQRVIEGAPVIPYGGEKPEKYTYPNGSTIWIGGMDKASKVLSSERDFVYVNQAEQLTLDEWETITTRTTGRGAVMPYTMTFGDCNPSGSKHWIRERSKVGKLQLIPTTHKDNPTLFDPATGEITEQGKRSLSRLDALTGVRRKRLYEGIWATAEGTVYDTFDTAIHVKVRPFAEMKAWYLAIDEGYTNPAVILLVGEDNDGRHQIFREFYKSGVLQSVVVQRAQELCDHVYDTSRKQAAMERANTDLALHVGLIAVDAAAAGLIAELRDNNLPATGAKGRVLDRIQAVQDRLKVQSDGLPRLTLDPSCENSINDFESRVWKPDRDEPLKGNDHATDAYEYLNTLATGNDAGLYQYRYA